MLCHACPHIWTDEELRNNRELQCPSCGAPTIAGIPGPQQDFLDSKAYLVIFGGGAGGTKSFSLFMEAARHVLETNFKAVIFRRTSPEIVQGGGAWDTAASFYPDLGLVGRQAHQFLDWRHPTSGASIKFSHLQYEKDKEKHKGAQYSLICFDELTGFEEEQFTYMMSRNRAAAGCSVKGYIRATTNPDADSWVRDWIAPWCVPSHPLYPTPYGECRYFRRFADEVPDDIQPMVLHRAEEGSRGRQMVWCKEGTPFAKPMTYIPAKMSDNPFLDSDYEGSVRALSKVERIRLLGEHPHCWLIRHSAGEIFNRDWFVKHEDIQPLPIYIHTVRSWDLAVSKDCGDYSVGLKVGVTAAGAYGVIDCVRGQWSAARVQQEISKAAKRDGRRVPIIIEEEKGAAGKSLIAAMRRLLPQHSVRASPTTGDKIVRSHKASALNEQGLIHLWRGTWREELINELDGFPTARHDDQTDALSAAVNALHPMVHSASAGRVKRPARKALSW